MGNLEKGQELTKESFEVFAARNLAAKKIIELGEPGMAKKQFGLTDEYLKKEEERNKKENLLIIKVIEKIVDALEKTENLRESSPDKIISLGAITNIRDFYERGTETGRIWDKLIRNLGMIQVGCKDGLIKYPDIPEPIKLGIFKTDFDRVIVEEVKRYDVSLNRDVIDLEVKVMNPVKSDTWVLSQKKREDENVPGRARRVIK